MDLIGQTLDYYRIGRMLGQGGMGAVYLATDTRTGREVALKVMHNHLAHNNQLQERFLREGSLVKPLDHPFVVRVLDLQMNPPRMYLVMEYINGGSLRQYLDQLPGPDEQRRLPLTEALQYTRQIAAALTYAHQTTATKNPMIHRDVKPENILLKDQGESQEPGKLRFQAMLTDFGLVRLMEGIGVSQTGSHAIGTFAYMAPEQARGEHPLDGRADIYSLGVVLYEITVGRLPVKPQMVLSLAHSPGDSLFRPPRSLLPDYPRELEDIVLKCLARNREDRFATARELEDALWLCQMNLASSGGNRTPVPGIVVRPARIEDATGTDLVNQVGMAQPPPASGISTGSQPDSRPGTPLVKQALVFPPVTADEEQIATSLQDPITEVPEAPAPDLVSGEPALLPKPEDIPTDIPLSPPEPVLAPSPAAPVEVPAPEPASPEPDPYPVIEDRLPPPDSGVRQASLEQEIVPAEHLRQYDCLVVRQAGKQVAVIPVNSRALRIGRDPGLEVVLASQFVSRLHARIDRDEHGRYFVTDLKSFNPTRLNQTTLRPGMRVEWQLDDLLEIGDFALQLELAVERLEALERIRKFQSETLQVTLTPNNARIDPGHPLRITVELTSHIRQEDELTLNVHGVPGDWCTIGQDRVRILPGKTIRTYLEFMPPRLASTRAGRHVFTLRVRSYRESREIALVSGTLHISEFQAFALDLHPYRLYMNGQFTLTIENQGNVSGNFHLEARDAEHALLFTLAATHLRLQPGEREQVAGRVEVNRRALVHGARLIPFDVIVRGNTGVQRTGGEVLVQADLLANPPQTPPYPGSYPVKGGRLPLTVPDPPGTESSMGRLPRSGPESIISPRPGSPADPGKRSNRDQRGPAWVPRWFRLILPFEHPGKMALIGLVNTALFSFLLFMSVLVLTGLGSTSFFYGIVSLTAGLLGIVTLVSVLATLFYTIKWITTLDL